MSFHLGDGSNVSGTESSSRACQGDKDDQAQKQTRESEASHGCRSDAGDVEMRWRRLGLGGWFDSDREDLMADFNTETVDAWFENREMRRVKIRNEEEGVQARRGYALAGKIVRQSFTSGIFLLPI